MLFPFRTKRKEKETKRREKPDENNNFKGTVLSVPFILPKNPRVDKGPQPLMFNPALTAQVLNKKIAEAAPPLLRNS